MNTSETLIKQIHEGVVTGGSSNDNLVQLSGLIGGYLNLKTIPDYAKAGEIR